MEDGDHSASDNQDWDWEEVLVPQSDNRQLHHNPNPNLRSLPNSDEEVEGLEGEGSFTDGDVICPDYFSLDNDHRRVDHENPRSEEGMEKGIDSDSGKHGCSQCDETQFGSGSWMDPGQFRLGKRRRNYSSSSSESSDSSSGGGSGSVSGLGSRNPLLTLQRHSECTHHSHFHDYDYREGFSGHTLEPFDPLAKSHLGNDSHGNGNGAGIVSGFEIESQPQKEEELESPNRGAQNSHYSEFSGDKDDKDVHVNMAVQDEAEKEDVKSSPENENENEKRSVAWWRVPLEMLKYCVLRVSPVWSLSVAAAAILGFVLYRRRWLSKMKRKSQGLHLNITVDDKKVSQFMSRAARLNEAFSVVKRVPIIRPSLPAPGLAPWPAMSLR